MTDTIAIEKVGHVLTIGLNRPEKRNAMSAEMFRGLAEAYTQLCDDAELRCGLLYSKLELFSSGLDLMDMAPVLMGGDDESRTNLVADDQVDPFNWASVAGEQGRLRDKPVVTAINGRCITAGIEIALSTDVIVAAEDTTFAQAEVTRGLMPLGGAIERFTTRFGWGNAMRWLLTGATFDANEAHRIGLVQEVVAPGQEFDRAMQIAEEISTVSPLGVRATLANAEIALSKGALAAAQDLRPRMLENISTSSDLQEGIASMMERREPVFRGK